MRRILVPRIPTADRPVELSAEEAGHATRVLRLGDGASVEAIDGSGRAVTARLKLEGKRAYLELARDERGRPLESRVPGDADIVPVVVELAALKGDAMSWAIEKCVELGVAAIRPILTAHTVVQVGKKGPEEFQARWQKIADQALKQCGRLTRIEIELPVPLEERLAGRPATAKNPRLWCDESSRTEAPLLEKLLAGLGEPESLILLIGPEGGWSERERGMIRATAEAVSLGPLVLRAETAALFAVSLAVARLRAGRSPA